MSVIFETVIKSNPIGRWYLELRDTSEDGRVEVCLDLEEYTMKIEDMGAEYGGDVEVSWSAEDNVTKEQINEVRMAIVEYEQQQQNQTPNEDSGFNPDAGAF